MSETRAFTVPGMSCGHCESAVIEEVSALDSVHSVLVNLETKRVEVSGERLDEQAIRDAIAEAGYEAA